MTTMAPLSRRRPEAVLGSNISTARSLDDALTTAGMDWTILDEPADNLTLLTDSGVTSTSIPGHRLLMRSDNHVTLGVVGNRYTPLNNAQAFALADSAKMLGARFSYAGELDHGRKSFLTMDIPEATVRIGGHDAVSFAIRLTTSHDGSGGITGDIQGTRLACTNGMRSKLGNAHRWNIRHTANADNRMDQARDALRHAFEHAKTFAAHAEAMIATPFSTGDFDNLISTLLIKPDEDASARAQNTWHRRRDELMTLFNNAETQEEGRLTRWGAYNAFAEWQDWYRPANNGTRGRAQRNFTTDSTGLTERAFELLAV